MLKVTQGRGGGTAAKTGSWAPDGREPTLPAFSICTSLPASVDSYIGSFTKPVLARLHVGFEAPKMNEAGEHPVCGSKCVRVMPGIQ